MQGEGSFILFFQLDRQSGSRPDWLANIYLVFLLEFLCFCFPAFCQPCSHTHLAYPSTPYALAMKLTETTQHIMVKSWACVRALFSRRSSRFSSVSLTDFSWFSTDSSLRNGSETLQKRSQQRSRNAWHYVGRCIWRCWPIMEGFMGTARVAEEQC